MSGDTKYSAVDIARMLAKSEHATFNNSSSERNNSRINGPSSYRSRTEYSNIQDRVSRRSRSRSPVQLYRRQRSRSRSPERPYHRPRQENKERTELSRDSVYSNERQYGSNYFGSQVNERDSRDLYNRHDIDQRAQQKPHPYNHSNHNNTQLHIDIVNLTNDNEILRSKINKLEAERIKILSKYDRMRLELENSNSRHEDTLSKLSISRKEGKLVNANFIRLKMNHNKLTSDYRKLKSDPMYLDFSYLGDVSTKRGLLSVNDRTANAQKLSIDIIFDQKKTFVDNTLCLYISKNGTKYRPYTARCKYGNRCLRSISRQCTYLHFDSNSHLYHLTKYISKNDTRVGTFFNIIDGKYVGLNVNAINVMLQKININCETRLSNYLRIMKLIENLEHEVKRNLAIDIKPDNK